MESSERSFDSAKDGGNLCAIARQLQHPTVGNRIVRDACNLGFTIRLLLVFDTIPSHDTFWRVWWQLGAQIFVYEDVELELSSSSFVVDSIPHYSCSRFTTPHYPPSENHSWLWLCPENIDSKAALNSQQTEAIQAMSRFYYPTPQLDVGFLRDAWNLRFRTRHLLVYDTIPSHGTYWCSWWYLRSQILVHEVVEFKLCSSTSGVDSNPHYSCSRFTAHHFHLPKITTDSKFVPKI